MSVNAVSTEDYVLFADKSKSIRGLNRHMLIGLLPVVFLMFGLSYFFLTFSIPIRSKTPPYLVRHVRVASLDPMLFAFFSWFPWFLVAECVVIYIVTANLLKKQIKPIVVLNSAGIQINILKTQIGPIYWNEIGEIRGYSFISHRFIGIVPKNLKDISQRMEKKQVWLFELNAACIPLYKPFGIFVAPINIPMDRLAISTDELLAHIRTYQAADRKQANQFHPRLRLPAAEGVWPPPPRCNGCTVAERERAYEAATDLYAAGPLTVTGAGKAQSGVASGERVSPADG